MLLYIDSLVSGYTATVTSPLESVRMNLAQAAECKLSRELVVAVACRIVDCWKEFAARLDPKKFTVEEVREIEHRNKEELFHQARNMLEDWTDYLDQEAKCRLIVKTFLAMDKRAQANSIFGEDLVKYIERTMDEV